MIGIIYKFTILTSGIFYVGQTANVIKFHNYWGSDSIWNDYLSSLKKKFPNCWQKLIKREILWQGECNQKTLDKLEEVYIRREHALHSENLGGCNLLPGAAIENNPAHSERFSQLTHKRMLGNTYNKGKTHTNQVKSLLSNISKKQWEDNPETGFTGKKHSEETKKKMSESAKRRMNNPDAKKRISEVQRGRKRSEETKRKMSIASKIWAENNKEKMAERMIKLKKKCPTPMKGKHHSEETKEKLRQAALKQFEEKGVPFKGHKHTEESKQKMSLTKKRIKNEKFN